MQNNLYKTFIVTLLIFIPALTVIILLSVNFIKPGYKEVSDDEHRHITEFTDVINAPVAEKAGKINDYIDDNMPLRHEINREISKFESSLNLSSNDDVIVGKEGWLYLTDSVKWHTDESKPDITELKTITGNLLKLQKRLNDASSKLVVYIVPDKVSIYPEYLPDNVYLNDQATPAVIDALTSSGIKVCFYKSEICDYKDRFQLYSKADTHWLSTASYISNRLLIEDLGSDNPPIEELTMFPKDFDGNDLARLINMADSYPVETDYDYVGYGMGRPMPQLLSWDPSGDGRRYHTDAAASLSVYVLHDSFFDAMEPFFTIAFSDTFIRHFDNYPEGEIFSDSYDIVILEVCERSLIRLLNEIK